jgi:chromosome segregation protein
MYLKSLELVGFKSFAKKTSLEFASPITGIVGPNGSGKSNVAEAFRFVLGEQSIKSMRGKRTEDLIWNGSQTVPRANRASVKLTFDNAPGAGKGAGSGRLFDVDFDSVTLERIIHRDSSSDYLLNGSPVRLRDIVEMLAKAHIGSTGHHIISQGEADRILSVNTRERKSMIEEALGLKIYHYKKEEGLKKLEKTDENVEKIKGLRREIQPHLIFLGKQVGKLEKAKELAEALKLSYKEYFARERAYLDAAATKLRREERPLKERLENLAKRLAQAQKTLAELEGGDTKSQDVLVLEKALSDLRTEKDELSRSMGRLEGELQALSREREREERRLRDDDERPMPVSRIRAHLERIEHALAAVASDAQASVLQTALVGVREALAGFRAFLEEGAAESEALGEIEKSIEVLEGKKQELEEKSRILEKKESDAKDRYLELQQEIEEDRTVGRDAERAVFALSSEAGTVRVELTRINGALQALALEEEEYKRDLGEAAALIGRDVRGTTETSVSVADEPRAAQHERKRSLERMKIRLEDSGVSGADELMKEYEDVKERDAFLERELADLTVSAESLRRLIADLEETLAREFDEGLGKINAQFTEFFSVMFGGGTARLSLVKEAPRRRRSVLDELDEANEANEADEASEAIEGIEIAVDLPRKKVRSLEMLSGGERALTSIALIFAMSQVNPPPFIILDETDAALDEANSRRYGDMIENLARHTQLILVTHNRETMSRAGVLFGVTMSRDAVSQLLSVSFADAVAVAK